MLKAFYVVNIWHRYFIGTDMEFCHLSYSVKYQVTHIMVFLKESSLLLCFILLIKLLHELSDCILGENYSDFQKEPSKGVLRKKCSRNMQQIYRRTRMSKCDFSKFVLIFVLINLPSSIRKRLLTLL